jgi:hypothetical protein
VTTATQQQHCSRILAATFVFFIAARPTILAFQRPHCIARLSSTAIGDYLCSTRFPLRSGCYGCVDRAGVNHRAGPTLAANYYDYMMYRSRERQRALWLTLLVPVDRGRSISCRVSDQELQAISMLNTALRNRLDSYNLASAVSSPAQLKGWLAMWIDPSLSCPVSSPDRGAETEKDSLPPSSCRCRRYDQRLCLLSCLVAVYCRGHRAAV